MPMSPHADTDAASKTKHTRRDFAAERDPRPPAAQRPHHRVLWPCYALERLLGTLTVQLGEEAETLITNTVKRYQKDSILSGGVGFTPEEKLEFV